MVEGSELQEAFRGIVEVGLCVAGLQEAVGEVGDVDAYDGEGVTVRGWMRNG